MNRARLLTLGKAIAALLVSLAVLLSFPSSVSVAPTGVAATSGTCGNNVTVSWSPAPRVGVFVFVAACGFSTPGATGFTSSFHNVTAWANSTSVIAGITDAYFQGLAGACTNPNNCKTIYFKDLRVKAGTFPSVSSSFGPFSGSRELSCLSTNVVSFNVTYTPTGVSHTFTSASAPPIPFVEQDFGQPCIV